MSRRQIRIIESPYLKHGEMVLVDLDVLAMHRHSILDLLADNPTEALQLMLRWFERDADAAFLPAQLKLEMPPQNLRTYEEQEALRNRWLAHRGVNFETPGYSRHGGVWDGELEPWYAVDTEPWHGEWVPPKRKLRLSIRWRIEDLLYVWGWRLRSRARRLFRR